METLSITRWEATSNGELHITVVSSPLTMSKSFIWKWHTTNNYGQGAKWCWWHKPSDGPPSYEVFGEKAQNLLTLLVYEHDTLSKLIKYYKLPMPEEF